MMLSVDDLSMDVHAVCADCGWLCSADDPDIAESDAAEHARRQRHSVQIISKFVQIYDGK